VACRGRRHLRGFGFLALGAVVALLVGGPGSFGSDSVAGAAPADATVSSFMAAPSSLSSSGGQVKLSAQVTGATSCEFSSNPTIAGLPVSVACSNGKVKTTVTVPSSVATVIETYRFTLTVTGASGPEATARAAVTEGHGGSPLAGVVSVTGGGYSYCALLSTSAVVCWGSNYYGQLGNGTTGGPDRYGYDSPQPVTGLSDAVSVSSDDDYGFCAVLSTGGVDCWGYNDFGQLGNGTTGGPDGEDGYDTPQAVIGLSDAVSVTSGDYYSVGSYCALLSTGGVDCWGYNYYGQLGNGTTGGPDGDGGYDTPQAVSGLSDAVSVSSDGYEQLNSFCAVLSTGGVDCWGYNNWGELGNGTTGGPDGQDGYDTPQAVTGLSDAVSVSSETDDSFCALLSTGGVDCWGDNYAGELGDGRTGGPDGEDGDDKPRAVTGLSDAVSVSSDFIGSFCAVLSTGAVDCWGLNAEGELGNGTTGGPDGDYGYDTPQAVTGLSDAVSVSSNGNYGFCAVLSTGAVDCWGYNYYGELGNGTTGGPDGTGTPQAVTSLSDAVSVSSSNNIDGGYCAQLSSGRVDCWGYNANGELGNGTTGGPDGKGGYDTSHPVAAA